MESAVAKSLQFVRKLRRGVTSDPPDAPGNPKSNKPMRRADLLLLSSIFVTAGCGARTNLDDRAIEAGGTMAASTGGAGAVATLGTGGSSMGGTKASGGASGSGCTGNFEVIQSKSGLCVARMTAIVSPGGYPNYNIDVTEVTKGQYDAWLATKPPLPSDVNCSYVTSYVEQGKSGVYDGPDAEHHPVVYTDWCDAFTYCKGVNKRLCGAIGGGSNYYGDFSNALTSQWYRACSSGGTYAFPYGNTYQADFCDGIDYWNDDSTRMQTVSVGSLPNCVTSSSGYAGVYDLSGNVWEWEDSCSGSDMSATCRVRGGAFHDFLGSYIPCGFDNLSYRQSVGSNFGFRCCSL